MVQSMEGNFNPARFCSPPAPSRMDLKPFFLSIFNKEREG